MRIAKNMEMIFIAATVILCSLNWEPQGLDNIGETVQESPQVQTVVVVGKRI